MPKTMTEENARLREVLGVLRSVVGDGLAQWLESQDEPDDTMVSVTTSMGALRQAAKLLRVME